MDWQHWMSWVYEPQAWIGLVTLTVLEMVLGIDNIVFISILSSKLPAEQQSRGRKLGLLMAMGTRIVLLLTLAWIIRLTAPLFAIWGHEFSGKDLILLGGGLFLLGKATFEIHERLEGSEHGRARAAAASLSAVVAQIMVLDIVFSLDSVITAVGMVREVPVMILAVMIAVGAMMLFADPVSDFVEKHPTVKMLALSFLLLIGLTLLADGLGTHISKGYVYFAMGFSVFVEMLNLKVRGRAAEPVHLHAPYSAKAGSGPAAKT